MTSLLPTATGVWNFSDMLRDEYLTLAEILRSQGFVTASFIQNGNAGPYNGLHQGFSLLLDEEVLGRTTEKILGDRLASWLDRHAERNFFLYLHVRDPHGPYDPPPPFDAWYHDAMRESPAEQRALALAADRKWLDPEWVERPTLVGRRLLYDGEIRHNDSLVGALVEQLESLGLREDTLIVLLSDHGEHLGEHGLWEHHPPGYRQVLHVPLILVHPAGLPEGRRIDQIVQLTDVMPTVLDGAPRPRWK